MIQAIFYKEWIKTRWYLLLATLFMIGITGYSMLRIGRTIAIQGIDHLWVVMVQKDAIFIDLLQFVPLLTGILLAAVHQFFPEMQRNVFETLPYIYLFTEEDGHGYVSLWSTCAVCMFCYEFYYHGSLFAATLYK